MTAVGMVAPCFEVLILRAMKRIGLRLLLGAWLLTVAAAGADSAAMPISKPAVSDQIVKVIEAQLAAFRAGDVAKAYTFASEPLRQQTPAPAFARIVQQNYPEIWQSTRAEFGLARDDGKRATVIVHVFAAKSDAAYDYVLFKENGGWKIGGVLRHEPSKANSF
jgi:hypothetical protein